MMKYFIEKGDNRVSIPCPGYPFCLHYNNKERSDKVLVRQNRNDLIIQCRDIVYCKSDKQYTWFHLADNQIKLSTKNIGIYEQILPDCFLRIHHNTILNLHFIKALQKIKNNIIVTLIDGTELKASNRKKTDFLKKAMLVQNRTI